MNIIIAGGRDFNDYEKMKAAVLTIYPNIANENHTIISGCAKGADSLGIRLAKELNIQCKLFPANWTAYGKSAGYKRNVEMADNADALVAFWDGKSKGTMHMINIAKERKLIYTVFKYTVKEE